MGSWAVVAFECGSSADRRRLLRWFERTHPVAFPVERYSVRAAIEAAGGRRPAEYAWLDRYLHVTTPGDPRPVVVRSIEDDRWERALVAELDRETATVTEGRLVRAAGEAVDGTVVRGARGLAGLGLLYALAMRRQFRFRPCAARTPPDAAGTYPDAFTDPADLTDDLQSFVRAMADCTGVDPTDDGRDFLRSDPAARERFVYDGPGGSARLSDSQRDRAARATPGTADGPLDLRDPGVASSADPTPRLQTDGGRARGGGSLLGRVRSLLR